METAEAFAEVNAPIWRVYENWKRFEAFPKFVPAIKEVRNAGDNRLVWREEFEGKVYEAVFEITLQLVENSLLWHSISGAKNSGVARFEPLKQGRTKVILKMDYLPDDAWQTPSAIKKRLHAYLKGFTRFIEDAANER